jgi:hypothetical protein
LRSNLDLTLLREGELAPGEQARATVFGLDVYANAPVPLLGKPRAGATGRELHLSVEPPGANDLAWPSTAAVICDERRPDGSVNFRIETHPDTGSHPDASYLFRGPEYGRHLLSADGRAARCFVNESVDGEWQRLLIAQVLPFATLLHGLEVFHASAVILDGHAIALVGSSGSGKTSVALELCRLGADFLADDVLTLEIVRGELLAHPGTPVAGVDREEVKRLRTSPDGDRATHRFENEVLLHNARELLIPVQGASAPAPLGALFFLDRRADGPPQPRFEPATDPQMLLAATFNFVFDDAKRLRGLLDVCSLVAAGRVERISANSSLQATCLGEAILERMGANSR